jgi:hypothetical protein
MTEVAVNGAAPGLDLKATKAALTSSSTSSRIASLRAVDDKLSQNGISQSAFPAAPPLLETSQADARPFRSS